MISKELLIHELLPTLETFFEENPAIARKILQKAEIARRAREAAKKARDLTRRKTVLESVIFRENLQIAQMKILQKLNCSSLRVILQAVLQKVPAIVIPSNFTTAR